MVVAVCACVEEDNVGVVIDEFPPRKSDIETPVLLDKYMKPHRIPVAVGMERTTDEFPSMATNTVEGTVMELDRLLDVDIAPLLMYRKCKKEGIACPKIDVS